MKAPRRPPLARGIASSRETDGRGPLERKDYGGRIAAFTPSTAGRAGGPVPREGVAAALNERGYDRSGRRWYDAGRLAASMSTARDEPVFAALWARCAEAWDAGVPCRVGVTDVAGAAVAGPAGTRHYMDPAGYAAFERALSARARAGTAPQP